MKLKKIKGFILLVSTAVFLFVGCSNNYKISNSEEGDNLVKIGLLLDDMGEEDESINQMSVRGLKEFEIDNSTPTIITSSNSIDDYRTNINKMIAAGAKLVWGAGYSTAKSLENASLEYPNINFLCMDNVYGSETMNENLGSVLFKTEEASFLMGYMAADLSKTNKLAFLGASKGAISDKAQYGFMAGVKTYMKEKNIEIDIYIDYVDSFSNDEKAYKVAKKLYNSGVDILYQDAGFSGLGAIEASKEEGKPIMLAEKKQMDLAGDMGLAAIDKDYSYVINDLSSRYVSGIEIFGKNIELGFKENALDLVVNQASIAKFNPNAHRNMLNLKDKLIKGQLAVPFNEKTYKEYIGEKKGD